MSVPCRDAGQRYKAAGEEARSELEALRREGGASEPLREREREPNERVLVREGLLVCGWVHTNLSLFRRQEAAGMSEVKKGVGVLSEYAVAETRDTFWNASTASFERVSDFKGTPWWRLGMCLKVTIIERERERESCNADAYAPSKWVL